MKRERQNQREARANSFRIALLMNPYFYKWQRVEQDSKSFVLRSSRPGWRWLGYWFNLVFEAFWICIVTFCLGMLIALPFLKAYGEFPTLTIVIGASILVFPISFVLNARSDPYTTLELRFFCSQQEIELLGRSAFGFLVVRPFQLNESVKITRECYDIDNGSYLIEQISITLDTSTRIVMEHLSPKELEYHMDFFLKVLPQYTTKEIQTT
jgi:hypothetical protein